MDDSRTRPLYTPASPIGHQKKADRCAAWISSAKNSTPPTEAGGRTGQGKIIPAATESLNTTAPPDGSSGSRRGRSERTHNTGGEPIGMGWDGMGGDNEIWVEAKQQEEQQPG
jgi:hypothetical protein